MSSKKATTRQFSQVGSFLLQTLKGMMLNFDQLQKPLSDSEKIKTLKAGFQKCLEEFVVPIGIHDLALSLDPAEIRQAWIQLWQKWDPTGIYNIVVPEPPTREQIQAEKDRDRVFIYLPPQLVTVPALAELGKLFPKIQSWSVSGSDDAKQIKNAKDLYGWLAVEMALNMPNPNTTEVQLRNIFSQQSAEGKTLNVYIIFGQFCKEVFGKYPDIPGWVRLLGSSYDGSVLSAYFREDGVLDVGHYWIPDIHDSNFGGRSVAV